MRQRSSLFWGIVLIILAVLILLNQQGWLQGNLFGYLWPAVIVVFGIWLILGAIGKRRSGSSVVQTLSIPLESARSARLKLEHAAGRLNLSAGASSTELLNGNFGSEVDHSSRMEGDQLQVKLRNSPNYWPWYPGESLDWDIRLNRDIPLNMKIDGGASASTIDLTELKVVELSINTGASKTDVSLPANAGNTLVDVHSGASSLSLRIPTGVAARIKVKSGIASINVDSSRFPRNADGVYQSADYATAANRADISVDTGVGSVEIK